MRRGHGFANILYGCLAKHLLAAKGPEHDQARDGKPSLNSRTPKELRLHSGKALQVSKKAHQGLLQTIGSYQDLLRPYLPCLSLIGAMGWSYSVASKGCGGYQTTKVCQVQGRSVNSGLFVTTPPQPEPKLMAESTDPGPRYLPYLDPSLVFFGILH